MERINVGEDPNPNSIKHLFGLVLCLWRYTMKPNKTNSSSSPKRSDLKGKGVSHTKGTFKFQPHKSTTLISALSLHVGGKVDSLDHIKGSSTPYQMMDSTGAICQPEQQSWCEKKQAAVHEEIKRMSRLPRNSTYVTHRLRVLNKILQLALIQEHELELLLAGLSL